jgi:hypothetical protein
MAQSSRPFLPGSGDCSYGLGVGRLWKTPEQFTHQAPSAAGRYELLDPVAWSRSFLVSVNRKMLEAEISVPQLMALNAYTKKKKLIIMTKC